jgi:hypothetical protein
MRGQHGFLAGAFNRRTSPAIYARRTAITVASDKTLCEHYASLAFAAITSISTLNSGRVNPETIINVDAGGGDAV